MADGRLDLVHPILVRGVEGLLPEHGRLFVVVGVFDGLHRGHAYLLRHLREEARRRAARPAVITFDAHPDEILRGAAPPVLCDAAERLARLAIDGVEVVVVAHFDDALRRTPYDAFLHGIASRVDLAGILMTPDAAFGHERRGTPDAVEALGRAGRDRFDTVVVPALELDGRPVRSSEIRGDVGAGRLADAARLLGRPHAVTGTLGADGTLDVPLPVALPPDGEYRVRIEPPIELVQEDGGRASLRLRDPSSVRRRQAVVRDARLRVGGRSAAEPGERVRVGFASGKG